MAVLLPFAVQFFHSFENHKHSACNAQNTVHFDVHEIDCSVFHFKINTNAIDFPNSFELTENLTNNNLIYSFNECLYAVNIPYKSSRAPPFLLI
jgi:hypothetical protein